MNDPIILKRYRNRKLYSPTHRRYLSIQEVISIVAEGYTIKVMDHNKKDITHKTLSFALVQELPKVFNSEQLHHLIKMVRGETKMKILFVEDNNDMVELYKPIFEKLGEVTHFKSSNAARKNLGREEGKCKYDLIICDHNIQRFEKDSRGLLAQGCEIYLHLRLGLKDDETPFIHFSSDPCPGKYELFYKDVTDGSTKDSNFYWLQKEYNSDITKLINEIRGETKTEGIEENEC